MVCRFLMAPTDQCHLQTSAVISKVPFLNSVNQFPIKNFYSSETKESFPVLYGKVVREPHPFDSCCLPQDPQHLDAWKRSVHRTDFDPKCEPPAKANFNQTTFYTTHFKLGDKPSQDDFQTENDCSYPSRPPLLNQRVKTNKTASSIYLSDGLHVSSPLSHYQDNYKPLLGYKPAEQNKWMKDDSLATMKEERLTRSRKSEMADNYPLWETHPMVMGKAPIGDTDIIPKVFVGSEDNSLHRDSYKPCISAKTTSVRDKHYGTIVLGNNKDLSCWAVSNLDAIHPTIKTFTPEIQRPKKKPPPRIPAVKPPFGEYAISTVQDTYKPQYTIPELADPEQYRRSHINLGDPDHIPFATTHHQRTFTRQPMRDCFPQVHYPPWRMGDRIHPDQKKSEMKINYTPHRGPGSEVNPFAAHQLRSSHIRLFDIDKWHGNTTYKEHFTHDGVKNVCNDDVNKNYEYRLRIPYFTLPDVKSTTAHVTIGIDDQSPLDFTRTMTLGPYRGCVGQKPDHEPILDQIDSDTRMYYKAPTVPC